jgi:hypothetical protein
VKVRDGKHYYQYEMASVKNLEKGTEDAESCGDIGEGGEKKKATKRIVGTRKQ